MQSTIETKDMLKDSFLKHAIGSRDHPKLVEAERASRGLFKAIWWDLVDMLWEQGGYLPMDFDKLAYILRYPTPEEVRRVVCDFGLFENDGQRLWNESALEGIQHKLEVSERRAENRRGTGSNNGRSTNEEQMNNECSTNENRSSDREIDREIDKRDISIAADAEKKDIYRLFFFKNFQKPEYELQRFLDRYEGNWCRTGSTVPEKDHMKLARNWKPEDKSQRFRDPGVLDWLKRFTAWVTPRGLDVDAFLRAVSNVILRDNGMIYLAMESPEWRERVVQAGAGITEEEVDELAKPFKGFTIGCWKS